MARDYYVRSLDLDGVVETIASAEGPSQMAAEWAERGSEDADGGSDYIDRIQVRDAVTGEAWLFECNVVRVVASVRWVRPEGER